MNENSTGQDPWAQTTGTSTDGANSGGEGASYGDSPRGRGQGGREMLVQLQQMIDTIATQAAPVMREVAAKAAELAAVAGEKAGPLAHRAAGVTEQVGQRFAARSKEFATELRQPREAEADAGADADTPFGSYMTASADMPDDTGAPTEPAWPSEEPATHSTEQNSDPYNS